MLFGLVLVVALSAYLRLSGITWGTNSGYGHYLNFHPDEFISIRGMSPISFREGKLEAPEAYFEGTFNYYLWAVPRMLHDVNAGKGPASRPKFINSQFQFILLSGRLMTVAFDLATLILLFAIIRNLTNQGLPALIGALLYGVIPMQVIYSHFMRTYTLSNLLCVLVIWLSLKALTHRNWWLFVITGAVAGLGAATRYPSALVLSVPCTLLLLEGQASNETWRDRIGKFLIQPPLWLLVSGFVLGLFAGEPMLFLKFRTVADAILLEASQYAPAGRENPFDLSPLWKYICVLIPFATYPLLWLLIYVSTFYVVFRRSLWPTVIPLLAFVALYTYSMAKGYLASYSRLTMLVMPVLCIFVGLACGEIFPRLARRPLAFRLVIIVVFLIILPSVVFDVAYDQAMKRQDVRQQLRGDMRELLRDRSATTIAVSENGCYFYTAMPAVFPLRSSNVTVEVEKSLVTPADFLVMGFERPIPDNLRNSTIRRVESGGAFRFLKAFSRPPTLFGTTLNWSKFPQDMTYPFPTILLFCRTKPDKGVETTDGTRSIPPR